MGLMAAIGSTFELRRKPGESRTIGVLDEIAALALLGAGVAYLYFDTFGGIVRWFFPMIGLTLLGYAPAGLAIVALLLHIIARLGDPASTVGTVAAMAFAAIALVIASLMGRSVPELLFGVYIWLPFFIAMALTQRRMQDRLINAMVPIFIIATAGVLLNLMVQFPWVGAEYEVLGQQKSAARDWQAYGVQRLCGFSRASFSAAAQILLGYCALEYRVRSLAWRAVAWVAGLVAIYYTTSKAPLMAMLLLPAVYLAIGRLRRTDGMRRRWGAIAIMAAWLLIVVGLPIVGILYGPALYPAGMGVGLHYSSLADRMLNTWPNAIALMDLRNPMQWLVGLGVGGIGSPQGLAHADMLNPGDNMAIYLFVSFGLLSTGFFYLLFRGGLRAIESEGRGRRDFALLIALLGIGATTNVIEGIFTVIVFGIICARQPSRRAQFLQHPPAQREE